MVQVNLKKTINKRTNRIMENIKEIKQIFSKPMESGTRPRRGRIVYEHDDLSLLKNEVIKQV